MNRWEIFAVALMITSYTLHVYHALGLAITAAVLAALFVLASLVARKRKRNQSNQSVGRGAKAEKAVFEDIEQISDGPGTSQSIGEQTKASNIVFKNIKQTSTTGTDDDK
jgi:hypothetical protein